MSEPTRTLAQRLRKLAGGMPFDSDFERRMILRDFADEADRLEQKVAALEAEIDRLADPNWCKRP